MSGTALTTLGDLRRRRYRLFADCTARYAGHGSWLDIEMLIERFGEDYVFINDRRIARACVCQQCGHRGAMLRLHPPD